MSELKRATINTPKNEGNWSRIFDQDIRARRDKDPADNIEGPDHGQAQEPITCGLAEQTTLNFPVYEILATLWHVICALG